jgi:hypothetical protein
VISANHRSTSFIHEALVRVKCRWKREWRSSHLCRIGRHGAVRSSAWISHHARPAHPRLRAQRHQELIQFLKIIDDAEPRDLDLHLILDNYATRKTPEVQGSSKPVMVGATGFEPVTPRL